MSELPLSTIPNPINARISLVPPADVPANMRGLLSSLYNTIQQILNAFVLFCGIGPQPRSIWNTLNSSSSTVFAQNMQRFYVRAYESILPGAIVNLFIDPTDSQLKVRAATASDPTAQADGFCNVVGGIQIGIVGEIILMNGICSYPGVSRGFRYWLSTASGQVTGSPVVTAGDLLQYIGIALEDGKLYCSIGPASVN